MAKKYIPSGYQIISIDVSDKSSGTGFTPETEDEKILYEILSSSKFTKPILLDIDTGAYHYIGFAIIDSDNDKICLRFGELGTSVSETITHGVNTLIWEEIEE